MSGTDGVEPVILARTPRARSTSCTTEVPADEDKGGRGEHHPSVKKLFRQREAVPARKHYGHDRESERCLLSVVWKQGTRRWTKMLVAAAQTPRKERAGDHRSQRTSKRKIEENSRKTCTDGRTEGWRDGWMDGRMYVQKK